MLYAAMNLGVYGLLRPSELLGISQYPDRALRRNQIGFYDSTNEEEINRQTNNLNENNLPQHIRINLEISKTDQIRKGKDVIIAAPLAIKAIWNWCCIRDKYFSTTDELFKLPNGKRLFTRQLLLHLRYCFKKIGFPNIYISGKCFRRGGTSSLITAGISTNDITPMGHWTSNNSQKCYISKQAKWNRMIQVSKQMEPIQQNKIIKKTKKKIRNKIQNTTVTSSLKPQINLKKRKSTVVLMQ